MTVTEKRLRAMVDAVEAERMEWAKKVIDGLVADGVARRRICIDMTNDKVFMAIGVDRAPVAESEIVFARSGVRLRTSPTSK
jgi:hypothetical protein